MRYIILLFIAFWAAGFHAQTLNQKEKVVEDTLTTKTRIGTFSFEDVYTPQPPLVVPPSPQAAIFNKYLNHEISDYNGLPQIEIPLYEIEIKGLKIPITLSYHAGGIKYMQYDGDIGAGWSINAGGYGITRTIRGKDDSSFKFYSEQDFNNLVRWQREGAKGYVGYNVALSMDGAGGFFEFCRGNRSYVDGEYDEFNYMTPGGSGQFIIAGRDNISTRQVVNTNPENKILLANTSALSLSDMTVVDGNGFTYYMGKHPVQNNVYEEGPLGRYNNRTGWPLRQIKSPYNETVEFNYVTHNISHDREYLFWDDYYTFNVSEAAQDEGSTDTYYASYNFDDTFYTSYGAAYKTYFINEIKTSKEIVEFVRYAPQPEMPYVVKEIRIKTLSGNLIKTIKLDYDTDPLHRLLTKVTVDDQIYNFDYFLETNSAINLYSDVWGYYKVSEQYSTWQNYLDERYKDDDILYRNNSVYGTQTMYKKLKDIFEWQNMITWVNRESNGETTHAFSLKKITFPTGGTTEYVYEPNQYKDYYQLSRPVITGAGQRIQKIISKTGHGAKPITTVFKYGKQENGYVDITNFNWGAVIYNYAQKNCSMTAYNVSMPGATIEPSAFVYHTTRTYSSRKPLQSDVNNNPPIVYSQVTRYQYDEEGNLLNNNGKTVSYYNASRGTPYSTAEGYVNDITFAYVNRYYLGRRALPDSICIFNSNNTLIQKEAYTYASGNGYGTEYDGIKTIVGTQINDNSSQRPIFMYPDNYVGGSTFSNFYSTVSIAQELLEGKTTTIYNGSSTPIVTTEAHLYNSRNQRTKTTQNNSTANSFVKEYKYPDSYSESIYTEMVNKNIIHPVVEQITSNNNVEIGRIKNVYTKGSKTQGFILPDRVESSASGASNLRTDISYDLYDVKGNLQQYTTLDGKVITLLWSYNGLHIIAEIQHATYAQVQSAATSLGLNLNTLLTTNSPDMGKVNRLRQNLNGSLITTFTYKPLVGVTSTTDPSSKVTYYDYDSHNRLKEVYRYKDNQKEIIEAYKYNFANQ